MGRTVRHAVRNSQARRAGGLTGQDPAQVCTQITLSLRTSRWSRVGDFPELSTFTGLESLRIAGAIYVAEIPG
jgi:hypothetical protein